MEADHAQNPAHNNTLGNNNESESSDNSISLSLLSSITMGELGKNDSELDISELSDDASTGTQFFSKVDADFEKYNPFYCGLNKIQQFTAPLRSQMSIGVVA